MSLSKNEWALVLSSLQSTKQEFEDYDYQDAALKRERIAEVTAVIVKVREMRKAAP
jgi:hypothetical protein